MNVYVSGQWAVHAARWTGNREEIIDVLQQLGVQGPLFTADEGDEHNMVVFSHGARELKMPLGSWIVAPGEGEIEVLTSDQFQAAGLRRQPGQRPVLSLEDDGPQPEAATGGLSPDRLLAMREVTVFAALDTMELIMERVRNLLGHGRHITKVTRWADSHNTPEVVTGLVQEGEVEMASRPGSMHLTVQLRPGFLINNFGIAAHAARGETTEAEVRARFQRNPGATANITRIRITGGMPGDGPALSDRIEIAKCDESGRWRETIIAFDSRTGPCTFGPVRQELSTFISALPSHTPEQVAGMLAAVEKAMYEHVSHPAEPDSESRDSQAAKPVVPSDPDMDLWRLQADVKAKIVEAGQAIAAMRRTDDPDFSWAKWGHAHGLLYEAVDVLEALSTAAGQGSEAAADDATAQGEWEVALARIAQLETALYVSVRSNVMCKHRFATTAEELTEHIKECTSLQGALVMQEGSGDEMVATMVANGWVLEEHAEFLAGKRVRTLRAPEGGLPMPDGMTLLAAIDDPGQSAAPDSAEPK